MTKKKRELIEILLDNITPDDWPERLQFAAQDKDCHAIWFYAEKPTISTYKDRYSIENQSGSKRKHGEFEPCKNWNKTIVTRDEFVKRWNERNEPVEIKTLTFSREVIDPVTLTEKMEKISIKPDADSEGWIQWNGGKMPVDKGTLIDVKYRNGEVNLHVSAGFPLVDNGSVSGKYACDWHSSESKYSIVAYRLHVPQEQKTPQQLALEKFGTDWHENEGVQPKLNGVVVDIKLSKTGISNKVDPAVWSWDLSQTNFIKEWRIHSDQAALLREPMPPCSEEILCRFVDEKSPLETQIGGDHYTKLAIQPMQYSMENGLDPLQHTVIKYVTRFRDKNGIEDLEKAKHCIDMLIEFERGKK